MTAAVAATMTFAIVPALRAATAGASVPPGPGPRVVWLGVRQGSAAAQAGGPRARAILVPLDYQDPAGPQMELAGRQARCDQAAAGAIFVDPGGPGGAGTFRIPAWIGSMPSVLLRDYNIVSWDQEAWARARRPVLPDAAPPNGVSSAAAPMPRRHQPQPVFVRRWAAFGTMCAARNGDLLQGVSTADTARDLDLLHRALGQPELDYIGLSYGAYLGATYANLFPRHVGRMVAGREYRIHRLDQRRTTEREPEPRCASAAPRRWPDPDRVPEHLRAAQHARVRVLSGQSCRRHGQMDALLTRLRQGRSPSAARPSPTPISSPTSATRSTSSSPRLPGDQRQRPGLVRRGRGAPGNLGRTRQHSEHQRPQRRRRPRRQRAMPGLSRVSRSSAATPPALPPAPSPACSSACSASGDGMISLPDLWG